MTRTAADTCRVEGWQLCVRHNAPVAPEQGRCGFDLHGEPCQIVTLYRDPIPDPDADLVEAVKGALAESFSAVFDPEIVRVMLATLRDRGECFHPDHQGDGLAEALNAGLVDCYIRSGSSVRMHYESDRAATDAFDALNAALDRVTER